MIFEEGGPLQAAAAREAYAMSDRGTWVSLKDKSDLVIAVQGNKLLFNQYGVMLVNPAKYPYVKKELGQQWQSPTTRSMESRFSGPNAS